MSPRRKVKSGETECDSEVAEAALKAVADLLVVIRGYRDGATIEAATYLTDIIERTRRFVRTHRNKAISERNMRLGRYVPMLELYLRSVDGSHRPRRWKLEVAGYCTRSDNESVFAREMEEQFPGFGDQLWSQETKRVLLEFRDYKKAACARVGEALTPVLKWRRVWDIVYGSERIESKILEADAWQSLKLAAVALGLPPDVLDEAIPKVLHELIENLRFEGRLAEACHHMVGGQYRWKGILGDPTSDAITSIMAYMEVVLVFKQEFVEGADIKRK